MVIWVNSSSKCTTCGLIKDFIGCLVVEALSWSIINLSDYHFKFFNGNILEISALWEIEPQYPVGIFVGSSLPCGIGIREINC